MSILSLRNGIKKRRWLLVIIFVALVIGLLGVYATSGRNLPSTGNKVDYDAQIASYQSAIDTARVTYQEKTDDYVSINSLAELLYNQAGVYIDAASFAATEGDSEKSLAYSDKSKPVYAEAATLFDEAYANIPEGLNDTGKAQLVVKAANCYAMAGENETAETKYLQAREIDVASYEVAMSYTQFLVSLGRYQDAKQELQVYKALLPADSTYLASIDSAIETLKQLIDANGKVAAPEDEAATDDADAENATE